jgi:hypothetical protein
MLLKHVAQANVAARSAAHVECALGPFVQLGLDKCACRAFSGDVGLFSANELGTRYAWSIIRLGDQATLARGPKSQALSRLRE